MICWVESGGPLNRAFTPSHLFAMVSFGDEAGSFGVLKNEGVSHRARLAFHASHEHRHDVLQMGVEVVDRLVIDAPGHHRKSRQGSIALDDRLVGEFAIGIALVFFLRRLDIEVLVLKSMGQLVPEGAHGFELLQRRHGISISLRQRNRDQADR